MADEPINLDDYRPKPDRGYPDTAPLHDAVDLILNYANDVTQMSAEQHGAVDLVAHELCVRANDIVRLAESISGAPASDER